MSWIWVCHLRDKVHVCVHACTCMYIYACATNACTCTYTCECVYLLYREAAGKAKEKLENTRRGETGEERRTRSSHGVRNVFFSFLYTSHFYLSVTSFIQLFLPPTVLPSFLPSLPRSFPPCFPPFLPLSLPPSLFFPPCSGVMVRVMMKMRRTLKVIMKCCLQGKVSVYVYST